MNLKAVSCTVSLSMRNVRCNISGTRNDLRTTIAAEPLFRCPLPQNAFSQTLENWRMVVPGPRALVSLDAEYMLEVELSMIHVRAA